MLVYDGECGFCRRCADWVLSRGKMPMPMPMPPSADLDLDLLSLTPAEVSAAGWWVATNRARF